MAKIKGKYTLRAGLSPIVNGYTFTNNDRSAELAAASDFMLTLSCDDIDRPINKVVSLISNNRLNVLRARLLTSGAPGLQPALNSSVAASILIIGRATNNVAGDSVGGFSFGLDHFGEWQDVGVIFQPEKVNDNYYLSIDHTYSKIFFDDYNLQSEYEGQTFNLFLEMEIDTAGVLDNGGAVV